jgi:trans-aconitate 2-methyltransferase
MLAGVTSPSWHPGQYGRYAGERARPFTDLIARVGTPDPRTVVDLGCGPGTMTATLADRWPAATVLGLDSSATMISTATPLARPGRLSFEFQTIENWEPGTADVIVSNAALQWVPGHVALLPRWAATLPAGGALAFQVPKSAGVPAGGIFTEVAGSARWADRLAVARATGGPRSVGSPVREVTEYTDLLCRAGLRVDAWETTYVHVLPGEDPVLEWFSGTGLRPYLDALRDDPAALADFRGEVAGRLREAYPAAPYGTLMPFPRIFVVAHRD